MPRRSQALLNHHFYHVSNHTPNGLPAFTHTHHYQRMTEAIWYYRYHQPQYKLSSYRTLNHAEKPKFLEKLEHHPKAVDVVCFCLITDQFHLILKQNMENGISRFMANIQNSYTRYFNSRAKRRGQLFSTQFDAHPLDTDEQILHQSRVIHRLPLQKSHISSPEQLKDYTWSSLSEYTGAKPEVLSFCLKTPILSQLPTQEDYLPFIINQ